jgi:nicotinamide-nucleotide amidase
MKKLFLNLKALLLSLKSHTASDVSKILLRNALKISTAESCTGGLISSRLTDIAGSSAYVKANFVTYSNEAKQKILNVSPQTLETFGAVSAQCAKEMAEGLLKLTKSDIVLCTTGVAGPSTSERKPVGLIYIACGYKENLIIREFKLDENYNRKNMKFLFSETALKMVLDIISE